MLTIVPWVAGLLVKIIENVIILFAIIYIYIAGNITLKKHKLFYDIVAGITVGAAAIFIMYGGYVIDQTSNLILDTRSIIFSVAGLFFSPLSVIIGAALGILYRVFAMGGYGLWPGILIILSSSLLGLSWKWIWKVKKANRLLEFYIFGLASAFLVLACGLPFFDYSQNLSTFLIIPFVIGLYPVFSAIACLPLSYQKNRFDNLRKLEQSELMLQSSIDATQNIEIFSIDNHGRYISFNRLHAQAIKADFGIDIHLGDAFPIDGSVKRVHHDMQQLLKQTLSQGSSRFEDELPSGKTLTCSLTALKNTKGDAIGMTVVCEDITEQKAHEKMILDLSYRDGLTGFSNRRFFNEKLAEMDTPPHWPLTIVMADINDLKLINDGFGHDTGDRVIVEVSRKMSVVFKDSLASFRIGGDEFIVLLANSTEDAIRERITQLNSQIREMMLGEVRVSVAFGVASKNGDGTIQDAIKIAEKEMYENKCAFLHKRQHYLTLTIEKRYFASHPLEEQRAQRISEWASLLGHHLGLSASEIAPLRILARLHNIGKIGLEQDSSKSLLMDSMDRSEMSRKHVEIGYHILSASGVYSEVALDVLSHHERFDGSGYPCGLSGEKIPIRARILAVLISYDVCLFPRDGKPPMDEKSAQAEIMRLAGSVLDPKIVESFIDALTTRPVQ